MAKRPAAAPPEQSLWWFELEKDATSMAKNLFAYFEDLYRRSEPRLKADLENLRLYAAASSNPVNGSRGTYAQNLPGVSGNDVSVSLIQVCIDTLTSKISEEQVRPLFITSGGDFAAQQLSEQLQAFADGVDYETKAAAVKLRAFVDACIFGTGFIHDFETDDGRIGIERAFPYEMFVDDADGFYGDPRNIYRVKYVDRTRMKKLYPKCADLIEQAEGLKDSDFTTLARTNLIRVVEAWHLPSVTGADDGRHVIAVSNCALVSESWDEDDFPFTVMRYNPKQIGYWGQGLSEILKKLQTELNTLLRKIQICMHFLSVPHWLKQAGAGIQFGAFNNQIGSVINHTGAPPELMVPNAVPSELFQHVNWIYEKAFEISGVSQMSASSKVPGYGTMSGSALRKYDDIQSDRFRYLGKLWQDFNCQLPQRWIMRARRIGNYRVTTVRKSATGKPQGLDIIEWKDIPLKEREYQIMIQPVSKFATDAPGAIQTGQELVQSGLMPSDTFKDLMNFPDLKAEQDLEGAARKLVQKIVFRILDKGIWHPPDPYMDLAYAMNYGTHKLNMAMADDMPDDKIEQLRTWISAVDDLMQQAQAAQAAQQMATQAQMGPTPSPSVPQPLAPASAPGALQ